MQALLAARLKNMSGSTGVQGRSLRGVKMDLQQRCVELSTSIVCAFAEVLCKEDLNKSKLIHYIQKDIRYIPL